MSNHFKKIAVIGNIAGGKTVLSRRLGEIHQVPVTHIDSLQFLSGMRMRPYPETIGLLNAITDRQDSWLIDGFGPLDILEKRLALADRIVFIDRPLWLHYWWCIKRQIQSLWSPRQELPEGCHELTWAHSKKLFRTLWQVHTKMRPELLRILNRESLKHKTVIVRTPRQWRSVYKKGLF